MKITKHQVKPLIRQLGAILRLLGQEEIKIECKGKGYSLRICGKQFSFKREPLSPAAVEQAVEKICMRVRHKCHLVSLTVNEQGVQHEQH
jgi:hypothetical protein